MEGRDTLRSVAGHGPRAQRRLCCWLCLPRLSPLVLSCLSSGFAPRAHLFPRVSLTLISLASQPSHSSCISSSSLVLHLFPLCTCLSLLLPLAALFSFCLSLYFPLVLFLSFGLSVSALRLVFHFCSLSVSVSELPLPITPFLSLGLPCSLFAFLSFPFLASPVSLYLPHFSSFSACLLFPLWLTC